MSAMKDLATEMGIDYSVPDTYTLISEGSDEVTEYVTVLDKGGNSVEYNVPRARAVAEYLGDE